jgi:exonuclease III
MKWFSRLVEHAAQLQKQGHHTHLVGDHNVAPADLDIYPTKPSAKDALVHPPRKVSPRSSDARLYKKGKGKEAKLCFMGHGLMENRHGLLVDACLTLADGHAERVAALHVRL